MKICWFGTYDPEYSRNQVLLSGLRLADAEVLECNVSTTGIKKYWQLITQLRALKNEYDYVYCAFPAFSTVVFAYLFQSRLIVTDAFFPIYDAVVKDRKTVSPYNPRAWFLYLLDIFQVILSDVVIVDTPSHKEYFSRWTTKNKIHVIPVGVHSTDFYPLNYVDNKSNFLVQFHGSYIPLQGIDKVVKAAALLKNHPDITFRFIGMGQELEAIKILISECDVHIEMLPWLSTAELNEKLNEADLILGIFGDVEKTDRVIPNKLYQGLAVGKPVLTKDTRVVRLFFSADDMYFSANDPAVIAERIIEIRDATEMRAQIAQNGYQKVRTLYTEVQLGKELVRILSR